MSEIFVGGHSFKQYHTGNNPPFMGNKDVRTGNRYKKPWDQITYQSQQRRVDNFDFAVHNAAFPHVTYDFPPDPSVPAEQPPPRTSPQAIAILQQATADTVSGMAEQVISMFAGTSAAIENNTQASQANKEASQENAEMLKITRAQVAINTKDIAKHTEEISALGQKINEVESTVGRVETKIGDNHIISSKALGTLTKRINNVELILKTPFGKEHGANVNALSVDTFPDQGGEDFTTPEPSPVNQPSNVFIFGNTRVVASSSSSPGGHRPHAFQCTPSELSGTFTFGFVPGHTTYDFTETLKLCLDTNPEGTPHFFGMGVDMIINQDNLPFKVEFDGDMMVPTIGVVFCKCDPTRHVSKEWMEDGLVFQEIVGFERLGLEWKEKECFGRTVKVLVANGPIDEDTLKKLRLLLAFPSEIEDQKVTKATDATVLYWKACRDKDTEEVIINDGEVQYKGPDELCFFGTKEEMFEEEFKEQIKAYVKDGELDAADSEEVLWTALVRLHCVHVCYLSFVSVDD